MFKRQENQLIDQTNFVEQAPFLEKQSSVLFDWQNIKKNRNLWPFMILAFCLVLLVLLFVIKAILQKNVPITEEVKEQNEVKISEPLKVRVEELKTDLKANNPTKQNLPFPQVDLEFNIN